MGKKGYLQISFAWLFAVVVGAFILFLAIYASYKFIGTEQEVSSAEAGKEIEILANALETGFESSKSSFFEMPAETRIKNDCDDFGTFGKQEFQIAQKTLNKWQEAKIETSFENHYIFSEKEIQGKKFYLFSKSFEFPFKVADVTYMTSAEINYCFIDAPSNIEKEMRALNQANLFTKNCPAESVKICFDTSLCDINIHTNQKSVEKNDKVVYYETDALMYAGIFSDEKIYECQISRLMKRLSELSLLYEEKSVILMKQNCVQEVDVASLRSISLGISNSEGLIGVRTLIQQLDAQNTIAECRLW